jgi:RNA polymerase sigma factor (TIGR02999 family)
MTRSQSQVTELLERWGGGEETAAEELLPLVYEELRGLARNYLRKERAGHTLETSALVHEAYVRLTDGSKVEWKGRSHFYGIASNTMRRILVDHARSHLYQKRGGGAAKVSLDEAYQLGTERPKDLVALDEALNLLAENDGKKAQIVEMRFFGGLSQPEIAEVLGVSLSTVERQWRVARAWLYQFLES